MRLYLKLVVGSVAILSMVLSLLFLMNYMKFQNILSNVVSSRLQVVVATAGKSISSATAIGLKLADVNDVPVLLARAKALDDEIERISVVDTGGRILFSTDEGTIGTAVADETARVARAATQAAWSRESDSFLITGMNLRNAVDQPLGGIVLTYSKTGYNAVIDEMFGKLIAGSVVVFLLFGLLMMMFARIGCREISNVFGFVSAQMDEQRREAGLLAPGSVRLAPDTRQWIDDFRKDVHRIETVKNVADKEIEQALIDLRAS